MEAIIIQDFAQAWRTLNADLITKHLAPNFRYDSQWVFESLDANGYADYIRSKFDAIKKRGSSPRVDVVPDNHSAVGKMLQLNQNGNLCFYRIQIENGKVIKADLCAF